MSYMRFARSLVVVGAAMFAAGCATLGRGTGTPDAGAIARLEKQRAARPNDAAVARSLGIAYYKSGKFTEARAHLEQAAKLDPRDGSATLYLGLTAEQQKDIPAARAAYQSYVRYGKTSKVRRQLEDRLAALTRQELAVAAKAAVAQEQRLSTQPGNAKTVAVMPLRFSGSDTTLRPLERGLAELIIIDLSRSHELTVVERSRIQALLDEIKLQQSGATDTATNVRAGKIIQAGRIVSGGIVQTADRLRVDAAIVNTQTSALAGGAGNENTLEQIFAIEKAIVAQLFDSLGVRLTAEERKALELTPTRNLQAFLAYSRGLMFEDQGRYGEAARAFYEASRLDPNFVQAQQKQTQTTSAAQGMTLNAATIEANLTGTTEENVARRSAVGEVVATGAGDGGGGNSARDVAETLNPSATQAAAEQAGARGAAAPIVSTPIRDPIGNESGSNRATVTIIIRIPNP
jgi:TolB-like protein/cytochrome c-type biogenesis protein CcmH/NrfG